MKNKALDYLNKDLIFHADMIVPIKRDTGEIIFADEKGVLLRESKSNAYMIAADDYASGIRFLDLIHEGMLFTTHHDFLVNPIKEKFGLSRVMEVNQAVYLKKDSLEVADTIEIKLLDESLLPLVEDTYGNNADEGYVKSRIANREMYGGFIEGKLCGFIGFHEEGSIGMLEILPEYRKRGYGTVLESFMTNLALSKGLLPFGQVKTGNIQSQGLQKKLGYEMSDKNIYWIN